MLNDSRVFAKLGRESGVVQFLTAMHPAIQVENLVKRFGAVTAVDGISFEVDQGEIFGILGPNGAGKTTALEIIEGLQKPTSGSVKVLGMDLAKSSREVKARIGVQLQSAAYFEFLSLQEILNLLGAFYPKQVPAGELLEMVGLADRAKARLKQLSGGQQQRFTVAASLVNQPELLILDEPTTGLDPQARRDMWELIRRVHERGITIVLTTHYMEEAQTLCQRLAIMDRGKLVASDTPSNLVAGLGEHYSVTVVFDRHLNEDERASLNGNAELVQDHAAALGGAAYRIRLDDGAAGLTGLLERFGGPDPLFKTANLEHLDITSATLEDVFLAITGNRLREEP